MKEMAFNQFKLLSVMGFAEMSREIEKKVFEMVNAKREILDQADVKTYLEEKELKGYLETVMDENKKARTQVRNHLEKPKHTKRKVISRDNNETLL